MDFTIEQALTVGATLARAGKFPEAAGLFSGVLIHEPNNVEARIRLGSALFENNRVHEALYHFWRARKIDRRNPMALMNYGLTLSQLGHPEEGLEDIERAVRLGDKMGLEPQVRAIQYNNLGNTLERLGRHQEAMEALDKGIALDPTDGFPYYNRGIVLLRLNRQKEAIESLKRSMELHDRHETLASRLNEADAKYNMAMAQLLLGNLGEGFENYEYRLQTSPEASHLPVRDFGLPSDKKWQRGQSIEGKKLLVHGEQGLGDALHMMRFIPWLKSLKPKEILFIEHSSIRPLLYDEPGVIVAQPGENLADRFDLWVGVMSLPYMHGIKSEDEIPPPYTVKISADNHAEAWRWLAPYADKVRVGFCWAGNFRHKNDKHRSIPLEDFATIFDAPVNFISIQQMRDADVETFAGLKERYPNLSALKLENFQETAAVIRNLDLVVTVDTSVAHLAGSLGVPTWVLIPKFATDWRWQLERTDSPWYPSITLYRQPKVGDWKTVLDRVKRDLTETAAQRVAASPQLSAAS